MLKISLENRCIKRYLADELRTEGKIYMQYRTLSFSVITVESRFLEPPRETKIGSRNRDLEISGVKLQRNKSKGNDF